MNSDPCMDRFSQPIPVAKCECLCGVVLIEGEDDGATCSACHAVVCEDCALKGECRHGDCEKVYCEKCAEGFLPAELKGGCVPCDNAWRRHQVQYDGFMAAVQASLGRTG